MGRWQMGKAWRLVFATAIITVAISPRSLHAQNRNSPPPLSQVIHSFNIERPEATAYAVWNEGRVQQHEVWFRVLGGDADYQQRLRVFKEQAPPRSPDTLPPVSEIVYEMENNRTSDWFYLGTENEFFTYYFDGDNRPDGAQIWDHSKAVRVRKTAYNNGDLYEISFEDLNTLDDYNDLEIEVVLIRR
ncbi:hypothetical protein PN498_19460 [Oscillatoria sp. CS-180]|uniref:hypothetical protein n=1 Tax=Oscillatoria sp. CS-180 TaxID=3021720 RepID=UPI00232B6782|nr:hypothetical protein [Oscillatoria sp. CS-180]MDB9528179.1 hypothetical protein [Oscillatoria sp. CS-180]